MGKASRRKSTRSPDENVRCRYCGRITSSPVRQRYVLLATELTDQPEAPGGSRWPHSNKATNPPPLCREAEIGRRAMLSALIPDGSWTDG